jgi:hypothetical protein
MKPPQRVIIYNGISGGETKSLRDSRRVYLKNQEEFKDSENHGQCGKCDQMIRKKSDGTLRKHFMGLGVNKFHCPGWADGGYF